MGMGCELAVKKALVVSIVLGVAVAGVEPSKKMMRLRQVPAMYVFGDSTLDVGNNNYLPGTNVPRANRPYYGIDLPGSGKPTGRFSNGYNTADFVGTHVVLLIIYIHKMSRLLCSCACKEKLKFSDKF